MRCWVFVIGGLRGARVPRSCTTLRGCGEVSETRRDAQQRAGWAFFADWTLGLRIASVLQAASSVNRGKASRSHACLTVRLALSSSGTNQYQRVAAPGTAKTH